MLRSISYKKYTKTHTIAIERYYSKCVLWTSTITITWEYDENQIRGVYPHQLRILRSTLTEYSPFYLLFKCSLK